MTPSSPIDPWEESIRCQVEDHGPDQIVVHAAGELDICSTPTLRRVLGRYLGGPLPVVLQAAHVDFMDCCGLGALVWARTRDPRFALIAPSEPVRRFLRLVAVRLACYDSVEQFLAARRAGVARGALV